MVLPALAIMGAALGGLGGVLARRKQHDGPSTIATSRA